MASTLTQSIRGVLGGLALAVLAQMPVAAAVRLELTHDGHSNLTIVVNHGGYATAEAASAASEGVDWFGPDQTAPTICTESFAATELRHYLCAVAGVPFGDPTQFPIVGDEAPAAGNLIVVGTANSNRQVARLLPAGAGFGPRPAPESFRRLARTVDGRQVTLLVGSDRVGTLYAVYDFLGALGVRWFSPGPSGEVVPHLASIELANLDRVDAPKFAVRGFWAEFFNEENEFVRPVGKKGTIEFFNWMARNRLNLWSSGEQGVPPGEMKKRGLHLSAGGHTFYTLIAPDAPYPYRHSQFRGSDRFTTPDPYPVSRDFKGDVNGDGVLSYSEAHPEWYGLGPDRKRHFTTDPFGYNFCTSNPWMQKEFMKNLVAKLATGDWKFADYLDWWPEDADHWCECDDCKALGSPTDRNLLMAHLIREGLKQAFAEGRLRRDVRVKFLIYRSAGVIEPPTRPLPAGFDYEGIMGTFFPIYRCYVHALDDPACTEFNRPYHDYLHAWQVSPYYKGQFMIGEYYNISYFRDLPILFTRSMEKDIRAYYNGGARAMHYMHVPMGNWGPRAITNYQFARMLWDPAVDVPAMKAEYFRLRYEQAGATMAAFYASLEKAMLNVPEYVATPGEDENLGGQLRKFAAGQTKNLFPYRHLRMHGDHPAPDDGPSLEDSVAELRTTARLLDQALAIEVSERARECLLEDEALFRYGEATVQLYYHLARATEFPVASFAWEQEIRAASLPAEYLDNHPVAKVAVHGGTKDMVRNALESTGVKSVYLQWRSLLP